MFFLDYAVVTTQVHEGEEAQQSVVVGVEVAILEGHVLGVPQRVDKFFALGMLAHHRGSSCCGDKANAVAQFAESASLQYLVAFRQRAVRTILVYKLVDALAVEEILYLLAILALPFAVGTAPLRAMFIGTRHES